MSTRSRAALAGLERLRDPADRELGAVGGRADLLRDDVRAARDHRHRQVLGLVVALLVGREVAGELGLRRPLQLEPDRGRRGCGAGRRLGLAARCRGRGRRRRRGLATMGPGSPRHCTRRTIAATASSAEPRFSSWFLLPHAGPRVRASSDDDRNRRGRRIDLGPPRLARVGSRRARSGRSAPRGASCATGSRGARRRRRSGRRRCR